MSLLKKTLPSCLLIMISAITCQYTLKTQPFQQQGDCILQKNFSRMMICRKESYEDFQSFFKDPESLFQKRLSVFKDRKHCRTTVFIKVHEKPYVIKKYNYYNFWRWIRRLPFLPHVGLKAWHYGELLLKNNIATPKPILYLQKRIGPFWTECYLVMELIEGPSAMEYFDPERSFQKEWPQTMHLLAEMLKQLDKLHILHGDLHLHNLLIIQGKPYLIDWDDIQQYPSYKGSYQREYQKQHVHKLLEGFEELSPMAKELYQKEMQLE